MSQMPPPLPGDDQPNPFAPAPMPMPGPPTYQAPGQPPMQPGMLGAIPLGMRPHRGGLILGLGITSLALPFVSFFGSIVFAPCGCAWVVSVGCAIAAWIMASNDLPLMAKRQMDASGMKQTSAGRTCAIISVALHAAWLLLIVIIVAILGVAVFAGRMGAAGGGAMP